MLLTDGTDPDTLFVKYNKTGTNNTTFAVFSDGETLTGTNSDSVSLSCVVDTAHTGSATYFVRCLLHKWFFCSS